MKRTLKDWVIAARPWSFPASGVPTTVIAAFIFFKSVSDGFNYNWINAILCIAGMILFQGAGNLISDYYDYVKGVDLKDSLNGVRHIQSGMFTPKEIITYGWCMLGAAVLVGLVIVLRTYSLPILCLGICGSLFAIFYPFLKYHALGDVDILLCYGFLPACGVSYATAGILMPEVLLVCIPAGLVTVAILHANNTRDIENDSRAGIKTITMAVGGRVSQYIYLGEIAIPFVLVALFVIFGILPWPCLFVFVSAPIAFGNVRTMLKGEPGKAEPIANLDQRTAQLQLLFGGLLIASIIVSAIFAL